MNKVLVATQMMLLAHDGHRRKYTGEPYVVHCVAVAQTVGDTASLRGTPWREDAVCAALLHDAWEDWPGRISLGEIERRLGRRVAEWVGQCTNVSKPEHGNRAARKEIDRMHFAAASSTAQTIKLADLLDNARTILMHDPGFALVFMREKRRLLTSLLLGDPELHAQALRVVTEYFTINPEKT